MPRLIVMLPAYNEEETLPPLLQSFSELFHDLREDWDPLVIVVDDGSTDETVQVTRDWKQRMPVKLVKHPRNRGLGEAIKTGLRAAVKCSDSPQDAIICMDADNTHPPEHVPSMLEEIAGGADIVIASRYRRGSEQHGVPVNRRLMSLGARFLFQTVMNIPGVRDYTCGFRAYRVGLIQRGLEQYGNKIITRQGFACTDQLLVNLVCLGDVTVEEVPFILRYDRKVGESKLDLKTTIFETLRLVFAARKKLRRNR